MEEEGELGGGGGQIGPFLQLRVEGRTKLEEVHNCVNNNLFEIPFFALFSVEQIGDRCGMLRSQRGSFCICRLSNAWVTYELGDH